MGLGPLHAVSLAEARVRARRSRQLLIEKRDPITVRDAERAALRHEREKEITFKECAT